MGLLGRARVRRRPSASGDRRGRDSASSSGRVCTPRIVGAEAMEQSVDADPQSRRKRSSTSASRDSTCARRQGGGAKAARTGPLEYTTPRARDSDRGQVVVAIGRGRSPRAPRRGHCVELDERRSSGHECAPVRPTSGRGDVGARPCSPTRARKRRDGRRPHRRPLLRGQLQGVLRHLHRAEIAWWDSPRKR